MRSRSTKRSSLGRFDFLLVVGASAPRKRAKGVLAEYARTTNPNPDLLRLGILQFAGNYSSYRGKDPKGLCSTRDLIQPRETWAMANNFGNKRDL